MKRIIFSSIERVSWKAWLISVCIVFAITGLAVGLNTSEWASWVQAIGSIGAIVGSFALARSESAKAEEAQRVTNMWQECELLHAAVDLAIEVEYCLADLVKKMQQRQSRRIREERLLQLQRSLEIFSQREMSAVILGRMLILQREVAYSLMAVRELGRSTASPTRICNAQLRLEKVSRCRNDLTTTGRYYDDILGRHADS